MTRYESPASFTPATHEKFDDDGVTVYAIWEILNRRKRIVFVGVAAGILVGAVAMLSWPAQEHVSTIIEIGTRVIDQKVALIESPQATSAKINEGYIPLVRNEYSRNYPDRKFIPMKASVPKNGELVVLESRAPPSEEAMQIQQHLDIVNLLQRDHERVLLLTKNELQQRIQQNEHVLSALRADRSLLVAAIGRLEERFTLMRAEIKEVERLLLRSERNLDLAFTETLTAPTAMAQLVISNDVQENRRKLSAMKEALLVALPEERDRLNKAIEDNQRARQERVATIENTRTQLANLQETRPLGGRPLPSPVLKQPQKSAVFLVALLIAVVVSAFAAVLVDFFVRIPHTERPRHTLVPE